MHSLVLGWKIEENRGKREGERKRKEDIKLLEGLFSRDDALNNRFEDILSPLPSFFSFFLSFLSSFLYFSSRFITHVNGERRAKERDVERRLFFFIYSQVDGTNALFKFAFPR